MVEYNISFLKKITALTILFFIISVIIFLFIYSGFNLNQDEKDNLNSIRTTIISLEENLVYQKERKSTLNQAYNQVVRDYNVLLVEQQNQELTLDSPVVKIANLNSEISKSKNKISKLKTDIASLKTTLGQ